MFGSVFCRGLVAVSVLPTSTSVLGGEQRLCGLRILGGTETVWLVNLGLFFHILCSVIFLVVA